MKIIVHSAIRSDAIRGSLGADDYSYYFVRKSFTTALEAFADVVAVQDPEHEVDTLYDASVAAGEPCLFLSFAPPHKTVLGLRCPTIPVFAWEFGTIPFEVWDEDVRNDWRAVFSVCRAAIALSSYTVRVVRESMGAHYPITAIPAPIFDQFADDRCTAPLARAATTLRIAGTVLDTALITAYRKAPVWPPEPVPLLSQGPISVRGLCFAPPETEPVPPPPEPSFLLPEPVVEPSTPDEPDIDPVAPITLSPAEPEPVIQAPASPPATAPGPQDIPPAADASPHPSIDPAPAPRPGLRRRLQISKHLMLEWYRLVLRDLLPGPLRSLNAFLGRGAYAAYRALFAARPTPPVPLLIHQPIAPVDPAPVPQAAASIIDPIPLPEAIVEPPPPTEPIEHTSLQAEPALEPPPYFEPIEHPAPEPEPEPEPAVPPPTAIAMVPPTGSPLADLVPLPRPIPPAEVTLDGIVYVSMFSPRDGRKNWFDIVTAFCWAFRDTPDATLLLKIVSRDHAYEPTLRHLLKELSPFSCRVVVLNGYLDTADYRALIACASYYVNASHCEGLCMPVTEFMSAAKPAIAPGHTAFEDYITSDNAFVIDSGIEHNVWPDDRRDFFRTTRYRIDWNGLMLAYRESYRVAHEDPERYLRMSHNAFESMRTFCATEPVARALRAFLETQAAHDLEQAA